jgi:hypothetical protein
MTKRTALTGKYNDGMLLEFIAGLKLGSESSNPPATRKQLLDLLSADIRGQIENNLPVIYWVKPKEILLNQIDGLIALNNANDPKLSLTYIDTVEHSGKTLRQGEPEFQEVLNKKLKSIKADADSDNFGQGLLAALRNSLRSKTITFKELGEKAAELVNILENSKNNINAICSYGDPTDVKDLRSLLTNDIQRAGYNFKQWLNSVAPAELLNPQEFLNGIDPNSELIFFGATFKNARGSIVNETSKKYFTQELAKLGINVKSTFGIGKFTAAGHTGAAFREAGIKKVEGINTPLTQEIQFLAGQYDKNVDRSAMTPFLNLQDHIDLSLEFKKQVSPTIKNLLYLNVSFVITQEASWNSSLGTQEKTAGNAIVESVWNKKKKEISDALKLRLTRAAVDGATEYFMGSPTINELLGKLLANTIKTGITKTVPGTSGKKSNAGKKGRTTTDRLLKAAGRSGKATLPKTARTSASTSPMRNMGDTTVVPVNLINLMNLINTHLQNTISANMGNGTSKNVLNYRTGRLASSAQVESMSYSREGTITAFYSYMKNPYATFSAGGKQSRPVSRDPKLLISTSIRQIAQQVVSNKLRAVSI